MLTQLFVTQRARATLMLPTLCCFLLGAVISGPLADWRARAPRHALPRWRWRIVLWGRGMETAGLAGLALALALAPPTLGLVLPYAMVSAFMKTALRSTRIAFSVDLLERTSESGAHVDRSGRHSPSGADAEHLDERGRPLVQKIHLGTLTAGTALTLALAHLAALLVGGQVLAIVGQAVWWLFLADVITNVAFGVLVWRYCAPPVAADAAELEPRQQRARSSSPTGAGSVIARFFQSHAEGLQFLAAPAQQPLLALLAGSFLVEVITEAYDDGMIVKHVLGGSDDALRYAELGSSLVALVTSALLPMVLRRLASIGRIFCVTMSLDALCISSAGLIAAAREPAAIAPFMAVLALDQTLTRASTSLTEVAQNSLSSAGLRGRIAGTYALIVIVGDMASQGLAVAAEERWGIPGLLCRAGLLQLMLVVAIIAWSRRALWRFGLALPAAAASRAGGGARGAPIGADQ
jgi:hypothetical protein